MSEARKALEAGIDIGRVEALEVTLGAERLCELVLLLRVRLRDAAARASVLAPEAEAGLPGLLHQSRGSAGSLGLAAVSQALSDLEIMVEGGALSDPMGRGALVAAMRALDPLIEVALSILAVRRAGGTGGHGGGAWKQ